jgi:hypothetical protein
VPGSIVAGHNNERIVREIQAIQSIEHLADSPIKLDYEIAVLSQAALAAKSLVRRMGQVNVCRGVIQKERLVLVVFNESNGFGGEIYRGAWKLAATAIEHCLIHYAFAILHSNDTAISYKDLGCRRRVVTEWYSEEGIKADFQRTGLHDSFLSRPSSITSGMRSFMTQSFSQVRQQYRPVRTP